MHKSVKQPPPLADKLLKLYYSSDVFEDLKGDQEAITY